MHIEGLKRWLVAGAKWFRFWILFSILANGIHGTGYLICEFKLIQIHINNLGLIIYIFGSESNETDQNYSCVGWVMGLD